MVNKKVSIGNTLVGFFLLLLIGGFLIFGGVHLLLWFSSLDKELIATLITAFSTIVISAITIASGRYYERLKETEAHFRETKVQLYDEILKELFSLFNNSGDKKKGGSYQKDDYLVKFLQEWQRKLTLWGGANVMTAYIVWKQHLSKGNPDAQTVFLMEKFILAMREDVGLSNKKLEGSLAHILLRDPELFLMHAKKNPHITFTELAKIEDGI